MPIYEYECKMCGYVTSFFEKARQRLSNFFKRKCEKCGSRRLNKILSTFTPNAVKSNADTMNELSKMGNINFIPRSPSMGGHHGPPPGGCPYANSTDSQSDD